MNKLHLTGLIVALIVSLILMIRVLQQRNHIHDSSNRIQPITIGDYIDIPKYLNTIDDTKYNTDGTTLFIFFNPECNICIEEIPLWNNLYKKYSNAINILGVGRDKEDNLRAFNTIYNVDYPLVSDYDGIIFRRLMVPRIPYFTFINDGEVIVIPNRNYPLGFFIHQIEEYINNLELRDI